MFGDLLSISYVDSCSYHRQVFWDGVTFLAAGHRMKRSDFIKDILEERGFQMQCQCKRYRKNQLFGRGQSQPPQYMPHSYFQQPYVQNNMMNEQGMPAYREGGAAPFHHQQNYGTADPSAYDGVAPEAFRDQSGYYHQGNWDGSMPNMQAGWQDNQWQNSYAEFPDQQFNQPHQQMIPQHHHDMMAQQPPAQTHGMMPQTGYIPEEHDDDFD